MVMIIVLVIIFPINVAGMNGVCSMDGVAESETVTQCFLSVLFQLGGQF